MNESLFYQAHRNNSCKSDKQACKSKARIAFDGLIYENNLLPCKMVPACPCTLYSKDPHLWTRCFQQHNQFQTTKKMNKEKISAKTNGTCSEQKSRQPAIPARQYGGTKFALYG